MERFDAKRIQTRRWRAHGRLFGVLPGPELVNGEPPSAGTRPATCSVRRVTTGPPALTVVSLFSET